jgi:UDP-N-acetylmuramoyl-L-alanyl-D-glutamate--2,6-diaminopimelate ligase
MRLGPLLSAADLPGAGIPIVTTRGDVAAVDIAGIGADSRTVGPGYLYCCVPGHRFDGHRFAAAAVAAGAVAVLSEQVLDVPVPQVVVGAVRPALGPLADAFHGHPSRHLTVAGVTGTNGKTTTVELLAAIFEADGRATATIGTLTGTRTTPEAPVLQATLAELRRRGVAAVAMEVSSHALDQHRVAAVHFTAATFTNLTQDHLDYHGTMERYFAAKARLFEPARTDVAVVNADSAWGRRLAEEAGRHGTPTITYSMSDVTDLELADGCSVFRWDGHTVRLRLRGRFNVVNAVAAATTARQLGVAHTDIVAGLGRVGSVRGRFEPVVLGQPFTVLVDYAHTPDGLEQALGAARELTAGEVIVVFGAGGDRDQAKRPLMGEAASRLADVVVLTSDNPRSEDPNLIVADIGAGMAGPARLLVEPDRAQAIRVALSAARAGDLVLIAGKGHETGQEVSGHTLPFDDARVAGSVLRDMLAGRPVTDRP